jgi:tetratricopeptide (TPR) repeat protein
MVYLISVSVFCEEVHSHDDILQKAIIAGLGKRYDEATQYLGEFESKRLGTSNSQEQEQYWILKYNLSKEMMLLDYRSSGVATQEKVNVFSTNYKKVFDFYDKRIAEYKRNGDFDALAEQISDYQQLMRQYVGYLQGVRVHDLAIQELYSHIDILKRYEEVYTKKDVVSVEDSQGVIKREEVLLCKKYGISTIEEIQISIIQACLGYMNDINNDKSRVELIRAYGEYVSAYPTHPHAGFYLNEKMVLEGKVDLDSLTNIYKNCEAKESQQFQNSVLGFCNSLNRAAKYDDALLFLSQIKEEYIPGERVAELHYQLASAYIGKGDYLNALKHYNVVAGITDRYQDVPSKIESITNISKIGESLVEDVNLSTSTRIDLVPKSGTSVTKNSVHEYSVGNENSSTNSSKTVVESSSTGSRIFQFQWWYFVGVIFVCAIGGAFFLRNRKR